MAKLTTAQCVKLANQAESQLDFWTAHNFYETAIQVYPSNGGELAQRHIESLKEKSAACRAQSLKEEA
jgi:hypothetical protein